MNQTQKKIRVLVVDDSAFMRVAIKKMMEEDACIEVIDTARNGEEALEKIKRLKPDLVTMDIEMPVMDGLTALEKVMSDNPVPVIMISALTEEGAQATFKALELGAVDFIPKGGKSYVNLDIIKISEQLRQKIRAIVSRNRLQLLENTIKRKPAAYKTAPLVLQGKINKRRKCQLVALGVSTGGPLALNYMLPQIPDDFSSSILIVQHMPPAFTGPFAKRLDSLCMIDVKEAEDGEILAPKTAYIAPGGIHMKVNKENNGKLRIALNTEPSDLLFIPSVNVMQLSAAEQFHGKILGVIMTGMGNDGLEGMKTIKNKGGVTLVQDEASCVVYGMPKACVDENVADHVVKLEDMAAEIYALSG